MSAFSQDNLLEVLKSYPKSCAYVVGFSGGADSTALLHALVKLKDRLDTPVSAVHVNHGLHSHADDWQQHCKVFCRQFGIELKCLKISLDRQSGRGLEAEARHLRYRAIEALLEQGATLLTAHHADDQAETLLLNLMRGSGVDGLSAMPEHRPLGNGFLQRPLLGYENRDLITYLERHEVEWIDDPSNEYLDHDRNFMRHRVVPLLEQRWPNINSRLSLTRHAMAGARALLEDMADAHLAENLRHRNVLEFSTSMAKDPHLFNLVIRRWVGRAGATPIPSQRLAELRQQLRGADSNHQVELRWNGRAIRFYQGELWLSESEAVQCPDMAWPANANALDLGPALGLLAFHSRDGSTQPAISSSTVATEGLKITSRAGTPSTLIRIRGHHKTLKSLFQGFGVPVWLRDSIPLLELDGELLAIGDWCLSDEFAATMKRAAYRLKWQPADPLLQFICSHQQQNSD